MIEEYNLETFVKNYIEALKELDTPKVLALIDALETDAQRAEAFAGVIKAIEADEALIKDNPKMLETLEFVKNIAVAREEAKKEAVTEAKAEVLTPSIKAECTVG